MIVEIYRIEGKPPYLVLIPDQEEIARIESVISNLTICDSVSTVLSLDTMKTVDGFRPVYVLSQTPPK